MRIDPNQFRAFLLSSPPGAWPPGFFACDAPAACGASKGSAASTGLRESALPQAEVCVSSSDQGKRLAARATQHRGFLTEFLPVLEKSQVRFSVVKANFLFLFPPTELPPQQWLEQQAALLAGLRGQKKEGNGEGIFDSVEILLLEDVRVSPIRRRRVDLGTPGTAFGETLPDEEDIQYEEQEDREGRNTRGDPSQSQQKTEEELDREFEYGVSLKFESQFCEDEYLFFAENRSYRQAWLDALTKSANTRGQIEALVEAASESGFAASRYWARCRALRYEAQRWKSQVQCNAENGEGKLRSCNSKEHDKLCERVVILEELVDALEGQLVMAEEEKSEEGMNREAAILQDALLVEAEKTNRLTQILCDLSETLPCDVGEQIRQLAKKLNSPSFPRPSPTVSADAAGTVRAKNDNLLQKTENQELGVLPMFSKAVFHGLSPLTRKEEERKGMEQRAAFGWSCPSSQAPSSLYGSPLSYASPPSAPGALSPLYTKREILSGPEGTCRETRCCERKNEPESETAKASEKNGQPFARLQRQSPSSCSTLRDANAVGSARSPLRRSVSPVVAARSRSASPSVSVSFTAPSCIRKGSVTLRKTSAPLSSSTDVPQRSKEASTIGGCPALLPPQGAPPASHQASAEEQGEVVSSVSPASPPMSLPKAGALQLSGAGSSDAPPKKLMVSKACAANVVHPAGGKESQPPLRLGSDPKCPPVRLPLSSASDNCSETIAPEGKSQGRATEKKPGDMMAKLKGKCPSKSKSCFAEKGPPCKKAALLKKGAEAGPQDKEKGSDTQPNEEAKRSSAKSVTDSPKKTENSGAASVVGPGKSGANEKASDNMEKEISSCPDREAQAAAEINKDVKAEAKVGSLSGTNPQGPVEPKTVSVKCPPANPPAKKGLDEADKGIEIPGDKGEEGTKREGGSNNSDELTQKLEHGETGAGNGAKSVIVGKGPPSKVVIMVAKGKVALVGQGPPSVGIPASHLPLPATTTESPCLLEKQSDHIRGTRSSRRSDTSATFAIPTMHPSLEARGNDSDKEARFGSEGSRHCGSAPTTNEHESGKITSYVKRKESTEGEMGAKKALNDLEKVVSSVSQDSFCRHSGTMDRQRNVVAFLLNEISEIDVEENPRNGKAAARRVTVDKERDYRGYRDVDVSKFLREPTTLQKTRHSLRKVATESDEHFPFGCHSSDRERDYEDLDKKRSRGRSSRSAVFGDDEDRFSSRTAPFCSGLASLESSEETSEEADTESEVYLSVIQKGTRSDSIDNLIKRLDARCRQASGTAPGSQEHSFKDIKNIDRGSKGPYGRFLVLERLRSLVEAEARAPDLLVCGSRGRRSTELLGACTRKTDKSSRKERQ
ncbi:UNVERIFIED_CONTAM: hypothetical protein HHA_221370 [Hammondia hammondi]|eukprot:XP_008886288.1 hypothetical protein HHA_221370 [Hammondia hammondi]